MKSFITCFLMMIACSFNLFAQTSTTVSVYQIFQDKCVSCHNNADPEAGLDLEGVGSTELEQALYVRNNIVDITPSNGHAADAGYDYIYPGRVDKSFIFRKINAGLDPMIDLDADAGEAMPPATEPQLAPEEKELIRQWLLFGAPEEEEVVSTETIYNYYNVNGLDAFTTPPPAPDPSEGFQIKMGPFFLNPAGESGDELEFYIKHEMDLPAATEVNRMDIKIANYSHHFIMYRFDPDIADGVEPGYRSTNNHSGLSVIASVQEAKDIVLPNKTAFLWASDVTLDLNSHYINYSSSNTYKAEAYVNVYTQASGTAEQQMFSTLVPNQDIWIPNNGNPISITDAITFPANLYVWNFGGHTHKYGTGYKIWKQLPGGGEGELLYDASCSDGIPGCASPFYDYQHIPARVYDNFIKINLFNGLIHEASYLNDGPVSVGWGPTSDDEMMLFGMMFVLDTAGLDLPTATHDRLQQLEGVYVHPNPVVDEVIFELPDSVEPLQVSVYDLLGNRVVLREGITSNELEIKRDGLLAGMYFYMVEDGVGKFASGKILVVD